MARRVGPWGRGSAPAGPRAPLYIIGFGFDTKQHADYTIRLTSRALSSIIGTMKSTISSKGQITVPAEVRRRLGLAVGTTVRFELRPDGVILRKGAAGEHVVDKVFGIIKPRRPVDSLALLDHMRGPRPGGRRARRR